MDELRIFVSSPGDVAEERALTARVLSRLQGEFLQRARLKPIFWEHEPLLATANFQEQIVSPSQADIVVCIIWSRLGTRLPGQFRRADGSAYASGTEYEFEVAVEAHRAHGKPELLVYRKTARPVVDLEDEGIVRSRLDQKRALDGFIRHWFHDAADGTLVAAFHPFESPVDFEEKLEIHMRKLIEIKLPPATERGLGEALPTWTAGSPFRGLATFESEHAAVFCGRSKATSEVVAALREQVRAGSAFVLVTGMSGGGKSSLLRAGVLTMLDTPGMVEDVACVRRCVMRPGDGGADLLAGLCVALVREGALPELALACGAGGASVVGAASRGGAVSRSEGESAGSAPGGSDAADAAVRLAERLRARPEAADGLVREALAVAAASVQRARGLAAQPQTRLALIVDQLEEIFTHGGDDPTRAAFVAVLAALSGSGRAWVLATLRSDFYARLEEVPALLELSRGHGQYQLPPLTPAEITALIRQPAQAAGLRYEEDAADGRLDDVLRDAATGDARALPLLEFTLEELYQRRTATGVMTHAAYREIGGLEGAIARRAEEVFAGLGDEARGALDAALHELVGLDRADGPYTRRWADQQRLYALAGAGPLVDALLHARLLVADLRGSAGAARAAVTLAHEALLTSWPRLREWLEQNRTLLRARSRVSAAAAQWVAEERAPDFLLAGGKPLEEARELLERIRGRLTESEIAFIETSAARAAERDREMCSLQDRLDLMNVDAVRQPLGWMFIVAGLLGSLISVAVHVMLKRSPDAPPMIPILAMWFVFLIVIGLLALSMLRRARIPKSLVSIQMVFTWGAVAGACMLNGINNELMHLTPLRSVSAAVLFLAIGFAATASVFHRGLLAVTAVLAAGSLAIAGSPNATMLVFAGLWAFVFCGFGVWLRSGAAAGVLSAGLAGGGVASSARP